MEFHIHINASTPKYSTKVKLCSIAESQQPVWIIGAKGIRHVKSEWWGVGISCNYFTISIGKSIESYKALS